jgi:hypothetical protein
MALEVGTYVAGLESRTLPYANRNQLTGAHEAVAAAAGDAKDTGDLGDRKQLI